MKRLITKKMRDSFRVSAGNRIRKWMSKAEFYTKDHFAGTEKARIKTLKRVVK